MSKFSVNAPINAVDVLMSENRFIGWKNGKFHCGTKEYGVHWLDANDNEIFSVIFDNRSDALFHAYYDGREDLLQFM